MSRNKGNTVSQLNPVQTEICTRITQKIFDMPISFFFREPVRLDEVPNYKETIKKPMDLSTVLVKLTDHAYKNVDQWKDDMNLIWNNAQKFNPEGNVVHHIAGDLQLVFKRKSEHIGKTEFDDWQNKVRKAYQKLQQVVDAKPMPKAKIILRSSN